MPQVYCKEMLEQTQRRIARGGAGRPSTPEVVQDEIVRLYAAGELTVKNIAVAVGVSEGTVYRVLNKRTRRVTE